MIPIGQEVASYVDFDQFIDGQSVDTCGFAAVILNHFATEHGKPYGASQSALIAAMQKYYTAYDGADIASNQNGMSLDQLFRLIVELGNHYQNLYPVGGIADPKAAFSGWIAAGYPVIIAISEDSVFDVALGGKPYAWNTTGYNHIITVSGMARSGNVLVRDTANVNRAGPREYDLSKLMIISATVFVPGWLARPSTNAPPSLSPPLPPVNPNQRKAFEIEWRSIVASASISSGIANQAWLDYQAGKFHGPATSLEYEDVDWNGNKVIVQDVAAGNYHWTGTEAVFYPYH